MVWNKRDFEKLIRALAKDSANIIWTDHVEQQMRKRHISFTMAIDALCHGVIRLEPECACEIIVITAIRFGD